MHHIFGIISKDVSFAETIGKELEMDYLVMARISHEFRARGDSATFYVACMNQDCVFKIQRLAQQYKDKGPVDLHLVTPDQSDFEQHMHLLEHQAADLGGLLVLQLDVPNEAAQAEIAAFTDAVGRTCLEHYIQRREPDAHPITAHHRIPAGLDVAYYGVCR